MECPSAIEAFYGYHFACRSVEQNLGPNCSRVATNREDDAHLANTNISIIRL
jgi:hypothetical protein